MRICSALVGMLLALVSLRFPLWFRCAFRFGPLRFSLWFRYSIFSLCASLFAWRFGFRFALCFAALRFAPLVQADRLPYVEQLPLLCLEQLRLEFALPFSMTVMVPATNCRFTRSSRCLNRRGFAATLRL